MTSISPDDRRLRNLTIEKFVAYLASNGWKMVPHPNQQILVFEGAVDDNGKPIKLILPSDEGFEDAPLRLSEAVNLLSAIQTASPDEIISEITSREDLTTYVNMERERHYAAVEESSWGYAPLLATLVFIAVIGFSVKEYAPDAWNKITAWATTSDVNFIPIVSAQDDIPLQNWKTYHIRTQDKGGANLEVVIGVLWDPYRWSLGSISQVSIDERDNIKYEVGQLLAALDANESRPIIAVGTASRENAKEHLDIEEARADARMRTLANLCISHFKAKNPPIYGLNLGAFNPNKTPIQFSASERRVILLVITKGADQADLTSGVKNALTQAGQDRSFVFDARDYSIFNSEQFEVIRVR